jgi:hypothetical protein
MEAVINGLADVLSGLPDMGQLADKAIEALNEAAKQQGITPEQLQQIEQEKNNLLKSKQDLSKAWQSL